MKSARPFLIVLGIIAAIGAAAVVAALIPSVQRWVLLRATAGRPGLKLEVARVSAGISGLSLSGVTVQRNGLNVQLDRLEADYSLWQVLFHHRLQIHQVTASGLNVDASRLTPAKARVAAAGAPAAAPGLLGELQLPFALVLDDCLVDGRALLPGGAAGAPPIEVVFKVTGGKFSPGQEGQLLLNATLRNSQAGAKVTALNALIDLRAVQTDQRTFSRVSLTAGVDAEGENLSVENRLKVTSLLTNGSSGEDYSVAVDTVQRGVVEKVLAVHAALPAGQKEYAGEWHLLVRAAQIEPFFLGAALPEFNAQGDGRFTFNPSTGAASLQGGVEARASQLEAIQPALRAIGPVSVSAKFDAAEAAGIATLHQLDVTLAGENPVLELHASSAAQLNFREKRLLVGPGGPGEVLDLKVLGLPVAWIRPFVHEADVSGGLITGRFVITAEQDQLRVHAAQPLHVSHVSLVQRGQLLLNQADLDLSLDAVLTAQLMTATISELSLKTPAGDVIAAHATVTFPLAGEPAVSILADYHADLPALLTPWLPLGRIKADGQADLTKTGPKIDLRRFSATITNGEGALLSKATELRPFTLNLDQRRASVAAGGKADLMGFTLGRVPLDRLPLNQPGAKLGGVVEQGEFVLAAEGDKLTGRTVTPMKLADVSLLQGGQPALTGLAIELQPSFELNGHTSAKAQTGDVTVRTAAGTTLLTAKGEATHAADAMLRSSLTFNLEVPVLSTQPLFANAQAVTAGRASGEVRAVLGTSTQVEARLTLNGLVAREGGQTLPVANLSFRAVAQGDGRLSVQAPLLLDRAGQRSDLNFSLELTPAHGVVGIDGKLTGDHVELADALSVLGVFTAASAPGGPEPVAAADPKVSADTAPAWSRFNGSLALDIKSVTRGSDWSMSGLTGTVLIEPARVSLARLAASFGEKGRLAAKAELKFTGGAAPYELGGDFSLDEFDAGKLFKALEPAKPATVEGLFTVKGNFAGGGETLDRLAGRTHGSFELTSRQGIFRGLQRTSNKVSMTSKAVELGASVLGSIFGAQKVTKAAEKVAGTAYFVDQLAQSLGELNYDQLNVKLVRDDSLNVTLEDISLVSPDIRLLGKGSVTYVADKPLLEQPLSVTLTLAGRGKIEELLGKLKLLDGKRDELGYAKISQPVSIAGSMAKPDPTAFFTRIASSKISDLLNTDN